MLDILIRHGLVVDGSGAQRFPADVGIEQGRIVEIGSLGEATAATVIDASGWMVSPGFVDMHSHADFTLPILPTADSLIHQGITTVVVGNCGASPAPLYPHNRRDVIGALEAPFFPLPWDRWSTFGSWLDFFGENRVSVNVVPLVGHGLIRGGTMGFSAAPASAGEMAEMQVEVHKAMEEGAIGLSTGLIYPPGSFASTEELIEFTRPAGERGGFYFSHIRGEGAPVLASIAEAIRIGRETGAAVQISHFKAFGPPNWDKAPRGLELIDEARAEGLDVTADMYPYVASNTSLKTKLPAWAHEGGKAAMLQRLADPAMRNKMATDMSQEGDFSGVSYDNVMISSSPQAPEYEGRFISELADAAAKSPTDWIFDALVETDLHMGMVLFAMSEDNVRMQLRHPALMIGSDAEGRSIEGSLSAGVPHPRNYGTFPRILGRYVREEGLLTFEQAIWKMCGLPAQKLRWHDRGLLKKNFQADVVVFNPETVIDAATFQEPHQYPIGIDHVIVNGRLVIHGGTHTSSLPGSVLRQQ